MSFDIKQVFDTFSASSFGGLKFKEILFNVCEPLVSINRDVFNGTGDTVTKFVLVGGSVTELVTNQSDLFGAINTLTQVETIMVSGNNITTLPSRALSGLKKLTKFEYHDRTVGMIEAHAFNDLPMLKELSVDAYRVADHAFTVGNNSDLVRLVLKFGKNTAPDAIGQHSFELTGRPTTVSFTSNKFTHLDQNNFASFLAENPLNRHKDMMPCADFVVAKDLKPDNVLIDNKDSKRSIKLCDFGLSKEVDILSDNYKQSTAKHTADFIDNVNYMAPEGQTTEYNHLIDVYSLALIGAKIYGFDSDDIRDGVFTQTIDCENNKNVTIEFAESPWPYSKEIYLDVKIAHTLRTITSKEFKMDANPRGRAIIFVTLPELANEAERFRSIFSQLLFDTEVNSLFTRDQIQTKLSEVATTDSNHGDAFIMMFIGDGYNEQIIGWRPDTDNEWPPPAGDCVNEAPLIDKLTMLDPQFNNHDNKQTYVMYACREGYPMWHSKQNGPIGNISHFGQTLSHTIAQYSVYKSLIEMFVMIVTDISDGESEESDTETNSYYGAGLSTGVQQVLNQRDHNLNSIVDQVLIDIRPDIIVVDSQLDLPSVARSGVPWIVVNTSQPLSVTVDKKCTQSVCLEIEVQKGLRVKITIPCIDDRDSLDKLTDIGRFDDINKFPKLVEHIAALLADKTTMINNEQHDRRYRYVSAINNCTLVYAKDLFCNDPIMLYNCIRNLRHLTILPADVWLCGYHKSGNTWLSEIVSLIMADGVVDRVKGQDVSKRVLNQIDPRVDFMGLYASSADPRIINTHVSPRYLPNNIATFCKVSKRSSGEVFDREFGQLIVYFRFR
ncbi:unnamed protein product [Medioppia subpectinata]|uniref:non-specific serine/threonine protein kinase n=1 Tax=Medioppia subpectinata TaxID=1979941 RepID=A0A7R9KN36_9ACAR|nr:unnamed protein product [Medioppia subpectinata]CAG2106299.1 unnamed protein product [Medioppia subpectinata]